jgi:hypothetical protein
VVKIECQYGTIKKFTHDREKTHGRGQAFEIYLMFA